MWSLFRSVPRFNSQKSLRDNFVAMCSLPFHKTRSEATVSLIQDLAYCSPLNYKLNLPPVSIPKGIDFSEIYKEKVENILNKNNFSQDDNKIESIRKALIDCDKSAEKCVSTEQLKSMVVDIEKYAPVSKVVEDLLQVEHDSAEVVQKKLLADVANLDLALKAIDCWYAWHRYNSAESERMVQIGRYRNEVSSSLRYYENVLQTLHEKSQQSLPFAATKEYREFKNENYRHDVLNAHLNPNALNNKLNIANRNDIFQGEKPSVWDRFRKVMHFAIFTPFLNLLLDTDSYNFFIDGFNVFSDLVRAF